MGALVRGKAVVTVPGMAYPEGSLRPVKVALAPRTHRKIRDASDLLTREAGRQVTMSEAVEIMYACWQASREAGR